MSECKICGKEISQVEELINGNLCFECRDKSSAEQLKKDLQENKETETFYESDVVCPYCGYRIEDTESYYVRQNQGEEQCPNCNKVFYFETNIEITYSTSRKDD